MANYINVGQVCGDFTYEISTRPLLKLSNVFFINNSGAPLNGSGSSPYSLYPSTGSNIFRYNNLEYYVYFNESLIRGGVNRQNLRYIDHTNTANGPTHSETSGIIQNQSVDLANPPSAGSSGTPGTSAWYTSQSSFDGLGSGVDTLAVIYRGTTYKAVNFSNLQMENWVTNNIITFPRPATILSTPTSSTAIYLYQQSQTSTYLSVTGTDASPTYSTTVINTIGATIPSPLYFTILKSGNHLDKTIRLALSLSSGASGSSSLVNLNIRSDFTVDYNGTIYVLSDTVPIPGENPADYPETNATLFRHTKTGRYLYWDQTGMNQAITGSRLQVVDYWQSGVTSTQIMQGMQFRFQDMTVTTNASAAGSSTIQDWYHWKVIRDITKTAAFTNTSNVAVSRPSATASQSNILVLGEPSGVLFGNTNTSSNTTPSKFEGWSLVNNAGSSSNALVYVRANETGGTPTPVGYLTVVPGQTNVTFVQSSNLPETIIGGQTTANAWTCFKCTTTSVSGHCNPISTGGTVTAIALGTISSVQILTDSQLSITIVNSGLSVSDPIFFRILLNGTPINLAAGSPTAWVAGGIFTVTVASPFIANFNYTIEFNSQATLVNPQNTSTTYQIPYFTGLTTISTTMAEYNFAYDYNDNRLLAILPGTSVIRTISLNSPYTVADYVGSTSTTVSAATSTTVTDGTGSAIVLRHLVDIFLRNGVTNAYFIDAGRVRSITHPTAGSSASCSTIAGAGGAINSRVTGDGTGSSVTFGNIGNISASLDPNYIFVTDTQTSTLKRIGISSGVVGQVTTIVGGTFSGTQFGTSGNSDGTGNLYGATPSSSTGRLNGPTGLVYTGGDGTSTGTIYICDTENNAIRLFDINNNQLTTVAGSLAAAGAGNVDGTVGTSRLTRPTRIAWVTSSNFFYFLDGSPSSMIKRLDISTNTVTTVVTNNDISGRFKNITYIDRPGTSKGRFVVSVFELSGVTKTYLLTFL